MNNINQFTAYDTIKVFLIIVISIGAIVAIFLSIFSYPSKKLVNILYKYPQNDIKRYYFYYQKATAYRLLFITHLIFSKIIKILSATATFITVYCAMDNNEFILLFSLLAAICEVISLTIPTEEYSKMYVCAARKLEYILNVENDLDNEKLGKLLNIAYQEAEKIIEDNFQ